MASGDVVQLSGSRNGANYPNFQSSVKYKITITEA
jgi:hypothetical protein